MVNYSKAVKQLKKKLKLSDDKLGEQLGLSGNSVWNWTSARTTPRGDNKVKLDKLLLDNGIAVDGESKPVKRRHIKQVNAVAADKNLLKTYYTQLALEKKIPSFRVEIQGINKTHVRELPPEKWAEIMTLLEDF